MGTRPSCNRAAARAGAGALLAACAAALAPAAQAQQADADAAAKAIVLRPLSFFKVDDLEFGDIVPNPTAAGTVRLFPNGSRTASAGILLVGSSHAPARFAGLGTTNQQINVSLGANSILITGPGPSMRVRNFEIGSTPTAILSTTPRRFRITSALGNFNFPVGGILEVGANQPEGEYSGTFTITLNYL
jgi:Domain of unknown function (DUF4402)